MSLSLISKIRTSLSTATLSALVLFYLVRPAIGQDTAEIDRAIEQAVARAMPSIVQIETVGGLQVVDDQPVSLGPKTGVVVRPQHIITASYNLRHQPSAVFVRLPNGQRVPATIVGTDSQFHLTVLQLEQDFELRPIPLANQETIRVGHTAIAIGKAYDPATPNISVGIVSAKGRIWGKAVQTDSKISSLNYGGALISLRGEMIGVLAPLSHRSNKVQAGNEWYDSGIGFAVNPHRLLANWTRLVSEESLKPGIAGLSLRGTNINADPCEIGVVVAGSPAHKAGLKEGDRITEANGQPIVRIAQWKHVLGSMYAGEKITISVQRDKQNQQLELKLVEQIPPYEQPMLDIVLDQRQAIPTVRAVGSTRQKDLIKGDRIEAINGEKLNSGDALKRAIAKTIVGQPIKISVLRDGQQLNIEMNSLPPSAAPWTDLPNLDLEVSQTTLTVPEAKNRIFTWRPSIGRSAYAFIWLLPAGKYDVDMLTQIWRPVVAATGVSVMLIESSEPERWQPDEVDTIIRARQLFGKRLREIASVQNDVDPKTASPIAFVIGGEQAGGVMACRTIAVQRELFAGVVLQDADWPSTLTPPKTIPSKPLLVYLKNRTASSESATESLFRREKFPLYVDKSSTPDQLALQLLNWVRTADRL